MQDLTLRAFRKDNSYFRTIEEREKISEVYSIPFQYETVTPLQWIKKTCLHRCIGKLDLLTPVKLEKSGKRSFLTPFQWETMLEYTVPVGNDAYIKAIFSL